MYKLLLCWRYLRTRYLAFVCIGSVMLGVATLIVVNAVMSGFSNKLKDRLHGLLSDVVIESPSYSGFALQPDEMMQMIRESSVGSDIEAMTPTVEVFAMLQYRFPGSGEPVTRLVRVVGVDPEGRASIGGFSEHLVHQKGDPSPSMEIPAETQEILRRHRQMMKRLQADSEPEPPNGGPPLLDPPPSDDPEDVGIIVGYTIASFRKPDATADTTEPDFFTLRLGDSIELTTIGAQDLTPVHSHFIVVDYFKSEMSEYDSHYVFVPLDYLQRLRAMEGRVTSIQMRLKPGVDSQKVVAELQQLFPSSSQYMVQTWQDKQGPLLAAISIERGILNVLLFLIVGVAGFGILSIFSMIVIEKTKDIGILKALGASNRGVMGIFVAYGFLLGVVGAALGTVLGLVFTDNINEIEHFLTAITGQEVFPRDVYYFNEIPTHIDAITVALINVGSIAIAVLFSLLPAARAASLHPIRALRYD